MRRAGIPTILLVAMLHIYWGLTLLYSQAALGATPLAGLYQRIPSQRLLALSLVTAGCAAIVAMGMRAGLLTMALLAPQQAALIASLWASLATAISGVYSDGTSVAGGWAHTSVDQAPMIAWAFAHAWAYIALHWGGGE